MRAAIYARVSSKGQEDGASLDAQVNACREYCDKNGYSVVEVIREIGSGRDEENRPKFRRLCVSAINSRYDAIIVHKYDRFARDMVLATTKRKLLEDSGVKLISISENLEYQRGDPAGFLSNGILSLVAEWYSINLAKETIKGQHQRIKEGVWPGVVPWGYKRQNGTIVIDQPAATWIKIAFAEYASNVWSLNDWSAEAFNRGYIRNGKKVRMQAWAEIFRNVFYTGTLKWAGLINKEGKHEAIVDMNVFEQVQQILDQNSAGVKTTRHAYLLRGRCHSVDKNKKMKSGTAKTPAGKLHKYYFIADHYAPVELINGKFIQLLTNVLVDKTKLYRLGLDSATIMALKVAHNVGEAWAHLEDFQQERLLNAMSVVVHLSGSRITRLEMDNIFSLNIRLNSDTSNTNHNNNFTFKRIERANSAP